MDGSALDVEDGALALAHVFRVGRHRWATGAKKLQRERAASRRAAVSAGMEEVGAATASGLRFLWCLVPEALVVLQHLLGFAGLTLSVARRVLRGLREAAGAALRALRDLGSATAASAPLGAAGLTGGGEIRRFPGLRLYPFWGCPMPSSGVFQEPPFELASHQQQHQCPRTGGGAGDAPTAFAAVVGTDQPLPSSPMSGSKLSPEASGVTEAGVAEPEKVTEELPSSPSRLSWVLCTRPVLLRDLALTGRTFFSFSW